MVDVIDFSEWNTYDGNSEGSGRSEKEWLTFEDKIGLFKYPKSEETTEHISEKLASDIANCLNIPCSKIDIGIYKHRLGSMSYIINKENENIFEGVSLITSVFQNYDKDTLYDSKKDCFYSLSMVLPIIEAFGFEKEFFAMLIFDALIGNTDRHHSNWAFLAHSINDIDFCPLYDNGSSLCCYVREKDIDSYLGKDLRRFNSLVNTKSKSRIRINEHIRKEPTHSDVLRYLYSSSKYRAFCMPTIEKVVQTLSKQRIYDILSEYSSDILSEKRKELILRFIINKIEIINNIFKGG